MSSVMEESGRWESEFQGRVSGALRSLLETKHLYQSTTVQFENLFPEKYRTAALRDGLAGAVQLSWQRFVERVSGLWEPSCPSPRVSPPGSEWRFDLPNASLFCHVCDRREAFNGVYGLDILRMPGGATFRQSRRTIQVFALSLLCQHCKQIPEVFLVQRDGPKLTHCGRAPMEQLETPAEIPKVVQRHFKDAVLAYNCGQWLPAIFMLRTTIEQWVLYALGKPEGLKADELIGRYMDSLPDSFKGRFPSLRPLYESLSGAVHSAVADEALFQDVRGQLQKHFDAWRVHEFPIGAPQEWNAQERRPPEKPA